MILSCSHEMIYLGAKGRRRDKRFKFRPPQPNLKGPQEHLTLAQIQARRDKAKDLCHLLGQQERDSV